MSEPVWPEVIGVEALLVSERQAAVMDAMLEKPGITITDTELGIKIITSEYYDGPPVILNSGPLTKLVMDWMVARGELELERDRLKGKEE